jgi:hypothetical protein
MIRMRVGEPTASTSFGSMPAALRLPVSRPVSGPSILLAPMPLSNSTTRSPVLMTSAFCCSTTLSVGRKLSVSVLASSSFDRPTKMSDLGSPIGNGPSETTVASMLPTLKR